MALRKTTSPPTPGAGAGAAPEPPAFRTSWHVVFYAVLRDHGLPGVDALAEVVLSKAPQRADVLLLRKQDLSRREGRGGGGGRARTLRPLFRLVEREALIEFKSPGRPLRRRDFAKLLGYGAQLHHLRFHEIGAYRNVLLCLVATRVTAALRGEIERMGVRTEAVARGYLLVETAPYRMLVVDLSEATQRDKDEWMSIFVPGKMLTARATRWLEEHMPAKEGRGDKKLKGHDAVRARLFEGMSAREILKAAGTERLLAAIPAKKRLAGLPPEERLAGLAPEERLAGLPPGERLAGLAPEERLAGLAPEQVVLGLPDTVLRALSEDFVRSLPAEVQATLRRRLRASKRTR